MDEPCSYEELRACLHDIALVNTLTLRSQANSLLAQWIDSVETGVVRTAAHRGCRLRLWRHASPHRRLGCEAQDRSDTDRHRSQPRCDSCGQGGDIAEQRIEWLVGDALSDHPTAIPTSCSRRCSRTIFRIRRSLGFSVGWNRRPGSAGSSTICIASRCRTTSSAVGEDLQSACLRPSRRACLDQAQLRAGGLVKAVCGGRDRARGGLYSRVSPGPSVRRTHQGLAGEPPQCACIIRMHYH